MPKGKYRKKKNKPPHAAPLPIHVTVREAPEGNTHESGEEDEKERMPNIFKRDWERIFTRNWERVRQWLNSSIHVMEALTALILVTYVTSDFFLWRQLKLSSTSAVVDQRPWVKATVIPINSVQAGGTITATARFVDSGKTPGQSFVVDLVIAKVTNGEEPVFDYSLNHTRVRGGIIYPGDSFDLAFERVDPYSKDATAKLILTPQEFDDFNRGGIFFVAYGTAKYTDFFRIEHWTNFCAPLISPKAATGSFKKCTEYNSIDNKS